MSIKSNQALNVPKNQENFSYDKYMNMYLVSGFDGSVKNGTFLKNLPEIGGKRSLEEFEIFDRCSR